jgi:predicted DsbA family dithiol-disulfide isomerase
LCFAVALLFSLISLVFAAVSGFYIGSYCILCLATYAVNLLLLYLTWIIRQRFNAGKLWSSLLADIGFLWSKRYASFPVFGLLGVGFVLTQLTFPAYWQISMPKAPAHVPTGLTTDGHPWIGAEQPKLEIVEFVDYQCFQCQKMHYYLREIVERYPDKIRLVHRNYPMDHEVNFIVPQAFHVGSGKLSLLSIYAAAVGKFWDMNDHLYQISRTGGAINLKDIAEATSMDARELSAALNDPRVKKRLEIDIHQGMKLRIFGTPCYVINGRVYQGFIPPEIISTVINGESS